jgi:hypothetical protein
LKANRFCALTDFGELQQNSHRCACPKIVRGRELENATMVYWCYVARRAVDLRKIEMKVNTMKRRDFNRLVLGAGVSPILAKSSLAQMSTEELQTTPSKAVAPSIIIKNSPRTYNQINVPRKYTSGRRRFTIYWTWSYPWEANRDVAELDNRFSTMTEVRRVSWPRYEKPEWSEREFLQGIAGTLELFHLSTVRFQNIVGEVTGHPV